MSRTDDLVSDLGHVALLLDHSLWHLLENMRRPEGSAETANYEVSRRDGDLMMALLTVTRDYAERALAEHERRVA